MTSLWKKGDEGVIIIIFCFQLWFMFILSRVISYGWFWDVNPKEWTHDRLVDKLFPIPMSRGKLQGCVSVDL